MASKTGGKIRDAFRTHLPEELNHEKEISLGPQMI
jgi:hypothetical protein